MIFCTYIHSFCILLQGWFISMKFFLVVQIKSYDVMIFNGCNGGRQSSVFCIGHVDKIFPSSTYVNICGCCIFVFHEIGLHMVFHPSELAILLICLGIESLHHIFYHILSIQKNHSIDNQLCHLEFQMNIFFTK